MDLGFDVVVTITGIVLVFAILVLLMAIITLEGKIFDAMNGKKAAAKAAPTVAAKPAAPAAKPAAAQAPAAPQVEQGIPADVVAAIMAAIYSMGSLSVLWSVFSRAPVSRGSASRAAGCTR